MFWRCSGLSEPFPSAACDLSRVLPSLIGGFYSLRGTRAPGVLSRCAHALARQQVRWPGGRRAVGAAHLVRVAAGQVLEQVAVARFPELLADGADRGVDHRIAVAPAHQVGAHLVEVLVGGLDQDHAGALRAQLLRLAAEPAPGHRAGGRGYALDRVPGERRVQARGRVEADDEVELLVAEDVQVARAPEAAVDVPVPVDRDGVVEAGDRAARR